MSPGDGVFDQGQESVGLLIAARGHVAVRNEPSLAPLGPRPPCRHAAVQTHAAARLT